MTPHSLVVATAGEFITDKYRMPADGPSLRSICLWTTQRKKPIFTQAVAHGFTETASETEGLIRTPRWITALGALRYSDLFAAVKHGARTCGARTLTHTRLGSWDGHIRLWKVDPKIKSFSPIGSFPVPGVINSLQFVSPGKGLLDEASWAWTRSGADAARVANGVSMRKPGPCLLVAGVGQEPRLGRWVTVKGNGARNCA